MGSLLASCGAGGAAASAGSPPVNSVAPVISGAVPAIGVILTCTTGTWSGSPTFAYQWFGDFGNKPGQTTNTYVITSADVVQGDDIQCRVTATNVGGSASAVSNTITVG